MTASMISANPFPVFAPVISRLRHSSIPAAGILLAGCNADMNTVATASGVAVASFFLTPVFSKITAMGFNATAWAANRFVGTNLPRLADEKGVGLPDAASAKILLGAADYTGLYQGVYYAGFAFGQVPMIYVSLALGDPAYCLGALAVSTLAPVLAVATAHALNGRAAA